MDLPLTSQGNKHMLVFQHLFLKWPMVYAMPDQKTEHIVKILVDEIVPFCGVPEALLSDRGKNLSHLMCNVCELLGVTKLHTTAYHRSAMGSLRGIIELSRLLSGSMLHDSECSGTDVARSSVGLLEHSP